jgi:hypothetical protein
MKLKSFAYLKKTKSSIDNEGLEPSAKKVEAKQIKQPTEDVKLLKKSNLLMESKYCYGCYNFSVAAPGTDLEMGFCRRINKDNKISFKVIQKTTMIRQCPGKIS